MELYHGSTYDFTEIDLSKARKGKDFGLGYYLTTNKSQAIRWATRGKMKKEETHIDKKCYGVFCWRNFFAVHVDAVAYGLKRVERQTNRQQDLQCRPIGVEAEQLEHVAHGVFEKIEVFEDHEYGEVDRNVAPQQPFCRGVFGSGNPQS